MTLLSRLERSLGRFAIPNLTLYLVCGQAAFLIMAMAQNRPDGANPFIEGHETEYGPNGYMTLEFDNEELFEIVHDADGKRLWAQPIDQDDLS